MSKNFESGCIVTAMKSMPSNEGKDFIKTEISLFVDSNAAYLKRVVYKGKDSPVNEEKLFVPWFWADDIYEKVHQISYFYNIVPEKRKAKMRYGISFGGEHLQIRLEWSYPIYIKMGYIEEIVDSVFDMWDDLKHNSDFWNDDCVMLLVKDCAIVGMKYVDKWKTHLKGIRVGSKLSIVRDKKNKYDSNAVSVLNSKGTHIAFIPEKDNSLIAFLLDKGRSFTVKVSDFVVEPKSEMVSIRVRVFLEKKSVTKKSTKKVQNKITASKKVKE